MKIAFVLAIALALPAAPVLAKGHSHSSKSHASSHRSSGSHSSETSSGRSKGGTVHFATGSARVASKAKSSRSNAAGSTGSTASTASSGTGASQVASAAGDCACGTGGICTGPRGGQYCMTSGGNKSYLRK